jgi:hypothetical protein
MQRSNNELSRTECRISALIAISLVAAITVAQGATPDFVDIRAEFNCTHRVQVGTNWHQNEWRHSVHCVVGMNVWLIEGDFAGNADIARLFTGTKVVERVVLTKGVAIGRKWTNTWPSEGVISNAAGAESLAWLAFCSGPYLKKTPAIPLPYPGGYFPHVNHDHRQVFHDGLGLPSRVEFFLPRALADGSSNVYSPDASYKVVESTNFLGWTFPLRFEARQSAGPGGGNGVELYDGADIVIVGHVTSIQHGKKPKMPTEAP